MRLSDTIFLTLTICLLQVYIGMRCLYEVRPATFPDASPLTIWFRRNTGVLQAVMMGLEKPLKAWGMAQVGVLVINSNGWDVQGGSCMYIKEAGGFDWMLCFSIIASLGSSALCFVYLDMNDHRFSRDRLHQAELAALFCYRTAELSARITLLALFAVCLIHFWSWR